MPGVSVKELEDRVRKELEDTSRGEMDGIGRLELEAREAVRGGTHVRDLGEGSGRGVPRFQAASTQPVQVSKCYDS